MPTAPVDGNDIHYVTDGDPADPAFLLITGLGLQLTAWPEGLVDLLRGHGFFVIRFDNRDSGLSAKLDGPPDLGAVLSGDSTSAPYRIDHLADDTASLLTHLGIARTHVAGMSMGGMITQALAIRYPALVASACTIMSTTGNPHVGAPTAEATTALLTPPGATREEAIARSVGISRAIGSPAYPVDDDVRWKLAAAAYDRSYSPRGFSRQLAAILSSPDRTDGLRKVRTPFLVIHGEDDPLITLSGGEATAAAVPGSRLLTFPGMGHDLPAPLWEQIADAMAANAGSTPPD
ncbi:alpha/beta fold hydrolase [Amycolatopsis sp. WQ 127309]|uniref:alpha/beta fold hydrolase n=1 Tax=Amycolatopsis sp. WQ 127309 TaxID=2932773 RepID=UPI001FF4EB46|nr:alpha/beta hydrolase [Amycolatopsis sp. WQ 127309]UOZ06030.1 alpha/beta fold hydrolase [Amycolatopsis sp. WQ 127309]